MDKLTFWQSIKKSMELALLHEPRNKQYLSLLYRAQEKIKELKHASQDI